MKKIFLLFTSILLLMFGFINIKAEETFIDLPKGMNYLSQDNIKLTNYPNQKFVFYAQTITPIKVNVGRTYTFVFDSDYLLVKPKVEWSENNLVFGCDVYLNKRIDEKTYYYCETTFKEEYVLFSYLPFGTKEKQVCMLYEGNIDMFTRLEPYLGLREAYQYVTFELPAEKSNMDGVIELLIEHINDGISNYMIINDYYTKNYYKCGEFYIDIYANFLDCNYHIFVITVIARDLEAPVIESSDYLYFEYGEIINRQSILNKVTIYDNSNNHLNTTVSILNDYCVINVTDAAENSTSKVLYYWRYNNKYGAVINGPSTIDILYSETLTNDEILSQYEINENRNIVINELAITNNSYNQTQELGNYNITLYVDCIEDGVNKEFEYLVNINVYEEAVEIGNIDTISLSLSRKNNVSEEEIIELIRESQEYNISNIYIVKNEYTGNENKAGKYNVYYSFTYNNQIYEGIIEINVENNILLPIVIISVTIVLLIATTTTLFLVKRRKKRWA